MAARSGSGFVPVDEPRVVVTSDGALAAIHEPGRVTILELPSGAPFAEIGVDPDATASEVGWVGTPGRLIVLSRYEAHSTVHLLDPRGPRTIAEIRLELPMRLVASVGSTALVVGALGASVLSATETHLTLYPFPTRAMPLAAGAAAAHVMVAMPGTIEEWDLQTRAPQRRVRLPRVAVITAVGGNERLLWMTSQQEPARIDVVPLVNRGQPRAHELPEPIARIAAHPRSDVLACLGAQTGTLYVVDLDGRVPSYGLVPDGIDEIASAALVIGRWNGVLVAQAGRPIGLVALERRAIVAAAGPASSAASATDADAESARVGSGARDDDPGDEREAVVAESDDPANEVDELDDPANEVDELDDPAHEVDELDDPANGVDELDDPAGAADSAWHVADDARRLASGALDEPALRPGADHAEYEVSSSRRPGAHDALSVTSPGDAPSDDELPAASPGIVGTSTDTLARSSLDDPAAAPAVRKPTDFAALRKRAAAPAETARLAVSPSPAARPAPRSGVRSLSLGDGSAAPNLGSFALRDDAAMPARLSLQDHAAASPPRAAPVLGRPSGAAPDEPASKPSAPHPSTSGPSSSAGTPSSSAALAASAAPSSAAQRRRDPAAPESAGNPEASGSWRDDVVAWSQAGARAGEAPAVPLIEDLAARLELAPELEPVLTLLYAAHLCGEHGVAPIEVARLLDRRWDEALGRGELADRGLASYAASRVALAPAALRMLDELPPATGVLVGEPGSVALLGPCVLVAGDEPLATIAAHSLDRVGGAILAAHANADRAALAFEARIYGAAAMLRAETIDPAASDPTIVVVADAELADRLGVPRLA